MSRARSVADLGNQSLNLSISDGALKVGAGATVENTGQSQFAGIVTATKFVGDGSLLTSVPGTGSGIVVKNSGSPVGTAATIDFGANLSVSALSAGIVTITGGAGGGDTVSIESSATDILSVSSGAISADDAGADKLVFWDDSASKLTYLTVGSNLTVTDTTIAASGSGGSGISDIVEDTTPQLGGNLDLNSKDITGTGDVNLTGVITATSLSVGSALDITSTNSASTIQADNSSQPFYIQGLNNSLISILAGSSSQGRVTVYNQGKVELVHAGSEKFETTSTGAEVFGNFIATTFSGDGSALTGVVTSITAGSNITLTGGPTGAITIAASGSGGSGISNVVEDTTPQLGGNLDLNSKDITGTGNVNLTGVITATSARFNGNVSVGGTLTYEDVTNIDSIGIVTARAGIKVLNSAGADISGVVTATTFSGSGASLTSIPAGQLTGTIADARFPATLPAASGANLTNLPAANITGTLPAISGVNLTGVVTSITAGSNITLTGGPTGAITIAASGGGGSDVTTRSTSRFVATAAQSAFSTSYTVGYVDVFLNGSKLDGTEYAATNGSSVSLTTAAAADDIVEIVAYETVGITSISSATQGLNVTGIITATGGIDAIGIQSGGVNISTGIITALNFIGTGNTFAVNGNVVDISIAGGGGESGSSGPDPVIMGMIF